MAKMKKFHPLFFSLLSGLLLFAAWPVSPLSFLIFFAFVPLLWLEQYCTRGGQFFRWTYLTMLVWNTTTTWWVCNSTIPGGIAAILANSLLMCFPWIAFYKVKRKMGEKYAYTALIFFWLSFEYIHLNWELSWPWLTLGNVFATHPDWVQWYEYTGASGGSLWIMTANILFFLLLRQKSQSSKFNTPYSISLAILLIVPLILSLILVNSAPGAPNTIKNIVIVQPNIDPWDEKFAAGSQEFQLQKLIRLSESQIDSNTALLIWPETAIPVQINEDEMKSNYFIRPVWDFLRKHPALNLLTGIEGFRFYNEQNKTPYSIKIPGTEKYVDTYNSAALLDSNNFRIYHKSKLVPGVETLPSFLKFLNTWFEKFGGTASGYAKQTDRTVLNTFNHSYQIAPAVCYESIYGEFMSAYIRKGADLIAIITNDGWWGDTPGYKQHESYARLRAIETRRWVARSANTGISCFIDPYGKVLNPQPWNKATAIKMQVPANTALTFYVRYGDLISKAAILGLGLSLVWYLIVSLLCKKQLSINR